MTPSSVYNRGLDNRLSRALYRPDQNRRLMLSYACRGEQKGTYDRKEKEKFGGVGSYGRRFIKI